MYLKELKYRPFTKKAQTQKKLDNLNHSLISLDQLRDNSCTILLKQKYLKVFTNKKYYTE